MKKETINLVKQIRSTEILEPFMCTVCSEHGAEAVIDDKIKSWCAVKPDAYYNSLNLVSTPPAVDCVITCQCKKHKFDHYLVELKSTTTSLTHEWDKVYRKFEKTIEKFIFNDFEEIYLSESGFIIKLVVVHRIVKTDLQLVTKKLFSQPINFREYQYNILVVPSPYTINRC